MKCFILWMLFYEKVVMSTLPTRITRSLQETLTLANQAKENLCHALGKSLCMQMHNFFSDVRRQRLREINQRECELLTKKYAHRLS